MPLSILVRLRGGRYDAGGERPSDAEWPPHPARVFCALAASADSDPDWSALRWLERQEPPQVWADPSSSAYRSQTRSYVVQNAVEKGGGGNLTWPGRTNGMRMRAFAVPSRESFAIVWPEAEPSDDMVSRLNRLAWNVPYLGRSTSAAEVSAVGQMPSGMPVSLIYEPVEFGRGGERWELRIPYVGYTDALRDAYADGRRAWEVARSRPYMAIQNGEQVEFPGNEQEAAAGPFGDLLIWGIERPVVRIGGDLVVSVASALRRAVLSRVPDPVPGQVSGYTDPGRPHVAYLALPDVGHDHADGHLLGVALAIPRAMPERDLTALARAVLLADPLKEVRLSAARPLAVGYGSGRAGLRAAQWTGGQDGDRDWVTVTPVMLDGHTRRGRDEASEIARSLVIAGYPRPAEVEVSLTPIVGGGIWRPRHGSLPPGRPRRQMVHARVRFAQPVIGPVLAGSMRYLGLGLFLPASRLSRPRQSSPAAHRAAATGLDGAATREPTEVPS